MSGADFTKTSKPKVLLKKIERCAASFPNFRCCLVQKVVGSRPSQIIPKTIIKMVQIASLDRHECVRVGV